MLCLLAACGPGDGHGTRSGSPADALPPEITQLLPEGMRPDWSADGRRLLFLDSLVGDVFELDLTTHAVRPLTRHFAHGGFTRARYLASGDLLLCGPRAQDAARPEGGRWHTELWWLAADASAPAVALEEPCFEGPAVSRVSGRIAWTRSDYPDKVVFGRSEIWTGEIVVEQGTPRLVKREKRLDRSDFHYLAFFETQDFRPPDERELIFTAYAHKGGEVMGLELETGALTNYSRDWGYDEAEGVFPDGRSVAVEREPDTYTLTPKGHIDIWRTSLDGSGASVRLTRFSDFAGFGANNPVVSPDGRFIAFGLRRSDGPHGNGHGIFVLDLREAGGSATDVESGAGSDAARRTDRPLRRRPPSGVRRVLAGGRPRHGASQVSTESPWHVESVDGESRFVVLASQLRDSPPHDETSRGRSR